MFYVVRLLSGTVTWMGQLTKDGKKRAFMRDEKDPSAGWKTFYAGREKFHAGRAWFYARGEDVTFDMLDWM